MSDDLHLWREDVRLGDTLLGFEDWQKRRDSAQTILLEVKWLGQESERAAFAINLCEHIMDTFNDDDTLLSCSPVQDPS